MHPLLLLDALGADALELRGLQPIFLVGLLFFHSCATFLGEPEAALDCQLSSFLVMEHDLAALIEDALVKDLGELLQVGAQMLFLGLIVFVIEHPLVCKWTKQKEQKETKEQQLVLEYFLIYEVDVAVG